MKKVVVSIALIALSITACKKKSENPSPSDVKVPGSFKQNGCLLLEVTYQYGSTPSTYTLDYDAQNRPIKITYKNTPYSSNGTGTPTSSISTYSYVGNVITSLDPDTAAYSNKDIDELNEKGYTVKRLSIKEMKENGVFKYNDTVSIVNNSYDGEDHLIKKVQSEGKNTYDYATKTIKAKTDPTSSETVHTWANGNLIKSVNSRNSGSGSSSYSSTSTTEYTYGKLENKFDLNNTGKPSLNLVSETKNTYMDSGSSTSISTTAYSYELNDKGMVTKETKTSNSGTNSTPSVYVSTYTYKCD